MLNKTIIEGIEKLISKYEYGQFNLIDYPASMEYDLENKTVKFQNFYRHDYLLSKDTCKGLMNKAYNDIRLTFKNLFVARAFGADDAYFKDPENSNHCFLLVNDVDMMNYCPIIQDAQGIVHALNTNPILVDPSFKKIIPASESKYIINSLINHSHNSNLNNSQTLYSNNTKRKFVPLVLNDSEDILHLTADFDSKHYLAIGIQEKDNTRNNIPTIPLESERLDKLYSKDKKSFQFIECLRNIPKKEINHSPN